eukprot:827837_1
MNASLSRFEARLFNVSKRWTHQKSHFKHKYVSELQPPDYNTDLMSSSQNKRKRSKLSDNLRAKYQIQLPIYKGTAREQHNKPKQSTETANVLQGESKLLHKFNQESDVYIKGNTQFINRKYEPLIEQLEHITKPLESAAHTNVTQTEMNSTLHGMDGTDDFDFEGVRKQSEDIGPKSPMKLHNNWDFFFKGDYSQSLFNEAETWNVIAHINKRYGYG